MIVPFTHFNYYLAHAYYPVDAITGHIIFDFHEYVKSQVHFNIASDLFKRDFKIYVRVLKILQSDNAKITSDVLLVLGYFYEDLANIVLQTINKTGDCGFDFDISVKLKGVSEYTVNLEEVRENLSDVLNLIQPRHRDTVDGISFMRGINADKRSNLQLSDVICKAATLSHFVKTPPIIKWR